jgi:hypothetical protein
LIDLGRLEEARQALADGKERYPNIPYHFQSARLAAAEGDQDGAREHLRLAREAYPDADERARRDPLLAELASG